MSETINGKPGTEALAEAIRDEYDADHVVIAIGVDDPEDGSIDFQLNSLTSSASFLRAVMEFLDIRAGALESIQEARNLLNGLDS